MSAILDMGSLGDSLFNQVALPIFILDGAYRIVRSNQPAQDLCGLDPATRLFSEALRLRPLVEGQEKGEAEGKDPLGDWIGARRHIAALDVFLEHPDLGTRFYMLDANPVTLSREGYEGGIVTLTDITERKLAEIRLRQSLEKQQQSQKMEAIELLAGGIAHDFNNLLLAILGFTELSLERIKDGDPIHGNLVEVKKAGEKAAALTGHLLAYSRKQMLAPKAGRVNGAIGDFLKVAQRIIGEKIRLRVDLAREELWSEIDQPKLQQALANLVLNARDAMPEGGELSIRTKRLDVSAHDTRGMVGEILRDTVDGLPPGDYVVIGIEDTGHGMDRAVMDRLIEPFFTTKAFGKGSGLGLSTAYGIIRQLGGYMQVFSDPGRGSHFKVVLPLSKSRSAPAASAQIQQDSGAQGNGRLILLVEDEEVVRRLLCKVLSDHGYRVLEASNGEDALAKLNGSGKRLALIVTDLVMDGMGGIELAEHLARSHPGVEILFMSGYAQDQHSLPKVGTERPHFAAKPFRPVEFLAKIRTILEATRAY